MPIDIIIEGLLFYKATPQKKSVVMKLLGLSTEELHVALTTLHQRLEAGATRLVETETDIQLTTAPILAPFIEALRKDELKGDIGKAGAETLAIILYRGPITRAEIDRIRGVNSSFILRNLLIRGLVERIGTTGTSHSYQITPTLLATLGSPTRHQLPHFATIMNELEQFETTTN